MRLKKKKKKELQSRRPYRRHTAKIGDILEYKASNGDENAEKILSMISTKSKGGLQK